MPETALAGVLSMLTFVVTLLVQIGAAIWVLMRVSGRPRALALVGLAAMMVSGIANVGFGFAAGSFSGTNVLIKMQLGFAVINVFFGAGLLSLVAAVITGRVMVRAAYASQPMPAYGSQNQMYGPGNAGPFVG